MWDMECERMILGGGLSMKNGLEMDGSITVFMAFIFLLLFALAGAALDSARYYGSKGYVTASAYGGEVAMYGGYNRELYENYSLFAYGGYDGIDKEDWREEFCRILQENLRERPVEGQESMVGSLGKYASVYQLGKLSVELKKSAVITQEKYFLKQVDDWIGTTGLKDITQEVMGKLQGTDTGQQGELLCDLKENTLVEEKKQQQEQEKQRQQQENQETGTDGEISETSGKNQESADKSALSGENPELGEVSTEEGSVENPIDFLKELLQDGVLSLVCDQDSISETVMETRQGGEDGSSGEVDWSQKDSGTGILKSLIGQQDSLWNDEMQADGTKKGKLILYATRMLDSYLSQGDSAVDYGLEYLVTGKTSSKDAFAAVVNRLFLIRTLVNYAYVEKNGAFQTASLETATAIAAPLMAEAFIPAIQHCILLVLSLEEACVDICALLDGRRVPMTKNQTSFLMRYDEICRAGKSLFQRKAATYPQIEGSSGWKKVNGGLGYEHYLWLMMLMQSESTLYQRMLDVIQYDLRERMNQTFTLEDCICYTKVKVTYEIPLLYSGFLKSSGSRRNARGTVTRSVTVRYGY